MGGYNLVEEIKKYGFYGIYWQSCKNLKEILKCIIMKGKKFRFWGFLSLIMFYSFVFMTITGIILYFPPLGKIAYWTFWKFFGISREI